MYHYGKEKWTKTVKHFVKQKIFCKNYDDMKIRNTGLAFEHKIDYYLSKPQVSVIKLYACLENVLIAWHSYSNNLYVGQNRTSLNYKI